MTASTTTRRRILLIDDHPLFTESLDLALTREGYDVRRAELPIGGGGSAKLARQLRGGRPSTVLLDLDLGRSGDGARLIPVLVECGCAVVVVSANLDRARWGQCLADGACTTLSKASRLDEIVAVLRRIDAGLPVQAPGERTELLRLWRQRCEEREHVHARLQALTVREAEVLGDLVLGWTVREIAARACVSEATVRTQVKAIRVKLGVSSQLAAVGLALRADWGVPAA